MGNARHALFALTLVLILFWIVVPTTVGQGAAGLYNVSTDYELFGTSDLHGGGHVTWSLTGARASEFRMRILHLFDEYPAIPRGFPFPNAPTKANGDGRLDAVEGASYTDLLEMQLEAGTRGTQAQYLTLFPFDLRNKVADPGTSFDRSTSGLAGTRANASAPVEIRFLFEANTSTTDAQVPLSTAVLAQAPFDIFSYEAVEDPTFAWPFPIGPAGAIGWHNVSVAGGPQAMWAGNLATGRYENNMDAYSTTTADPTYATNPAYLPFDFRFASRAWITFNYTGSLNDAGDYLRLEYAAAPYTSWSNVTLGSGADLPPSVGVWTQEMADLSGLLGQRVRLRLHFHSDSVGTGPGFYLRDFQVRAPVDSGEVVAGDAHYLVGTLSFSDPRLGAGGLQIVRTPGGELMTYSASWGPSGPPGDTIRFRTFDGFENPQILFGVMIAACYAISRFQESAYEAFRLAHPPVYRPLLHRAKWLHRIGLVASGLLILFYFVPTVLGFVGLRVFVSGPAYWIMAVAGVLLFGFGSRLYYRQRLDRAPPMDVAEEPPAVPKIIIPASVAGGVGGPRNQLSLRLRAPPATPGGRQAVLDRRQRSRDRGQLDAGPREGRPARDHPDDGVPGTPAERVPDQEGPDRADLREGLGGGRPEAARPCGPPGNAPSRPRRQGRRGPVRWTRSDRRRGLPGRRDQIPPQGERHGVRPRSHGHRSNRAGKTGGPGRQATQRRVRRVPRLVRTVIRQLFGRPDPSDADGMLNAELVQDPGDNEVDEVCDSFRRTIETRGRGEHNDPNLRELQEVLQGDGA